MCLHRTVSLALLFLSSWAPVAAQTVVRGRVTDAETGGPLPSATVQIEDTFRGTITNADGRYELAIDHVPAVVVFRYLGFETYRVDVTAPSDTLVNVALQPVTLSLGELVVTDEDPAVNIMRKVIERKQAWWDSLASYRAEAYTRIRLENDTSIVLVDESFSTLYWDRDRGPREVITSRRRTKNIPFEESLAAAAFTPNFYKDEIEMSGYHVIGPTHPDALRYYRFKLVGRSYIDDQLVYEIEMTPRTKLQPTFEGTIHVLDDVYALLDVDVVPSDVVRFPPPIQQFDVHVAQQFSNFGGPFWLPVDVRLDGAIRFGIPGLQFPTVNVARVSRLTDYQVNVPAPDSLYRRPRIVRLDTLAIQRDSLFTRAETIVPLSLDEEQAYVQIDSTDDVADAFQPSGFLARFVNTRSDGDGASASTGGSKPLGRLHLAPQVWFNRVDAAHAGLSSTVHLGSWLTVRGIGAYMTGPRAWSYGGGLTFHLSRRFDLEGDYHYGYDTRFSAQTASRLTNSAVMLFGGDDFFDYYGNERIHGNLVYDVPRRGLVLSAGFRNERHFSVTKTSDYDLLDGGATRRANPPITAGTLRSLALRVVWGDATTTLGVTGQRRLILEAEQSSPHLFGSDFDFTRVSAVADWTMPTFLKRRLLPNTLDVRVVGTVSRGDLPLQRVGIVESSQVGLTPYGSLRTRLGRPYEGDQALGVFWEHNFRTVPFELLGWDFPVRKNYAIIVHGGLGRTWISGRKGAFGAFVPPHPSAFHQEIGISLSGLFSLFRVDVTTRLDAPGLTFGIGPARLF